MSNARQLAANLPREGGLSNRNLIINGAMQVWQRGVSGFGHNSFSADRWVEFTNTNDGLSVSKIDVPSSGETGLPRQFTSMAKFALTAGSTGNLNDLRQKVEHPKGLAGQTLTLSYYIKASSSCTVQNRRVSFEQVTNAPTGVSLPDINITTSWQRIVDTFTLGSNGNAVYSGSSFLDVILSLPVHTTVDVYMTGVQLEVGDTATPFEHRSYAQEHQLCDRFFQSYDLSGGYIGLCAAQAFNSTQSMVAFAFRTRMRAAPSMSVNNLIITDRIAYDSLISSVTIQGASPSGVSFRTLQAATGATARHAQHITSKNGTTDAYANFDAEL